MKEVALLIVATNKYVQFLEQLLDSADKFFLKECEVTFHVFTDRTLDAFDVVKNKRYFERVKIHKVEHKPFPFPTLHRFHFFQANRDYLQADHFFYVDVDARFCAPITDEILGERVGVQHCGYVGERGTYETNPNSLSYVAPNEGKTYFGGGFWGFSESEFWWTVDNAVDMIDADAQNGIVPVWHDESVLNRLMIDNPPDVVLSPSYHFPENNPHIYGKWQRLGLSFECKILLLDKNHQKVRE